MRSPTKTAAPAPGSRSPQPPAYGVPSPELIARADRGFARFLAHHTEDQDSHADDEAPQQ
ncbi:hypothetical protein ACF07T_38980 [Streptomyces sp. NPDC015184]|uniref:hypothetical protein n=1 Tax=Streptomyces sp. NPDC015184 TaxID=3364946 RepID=UPI0036FFF1E2